jgi:hypothetical protein
MFWSVGHRLPGGFYGRVGGYSGFRYSGFGYGGPQPPPDPQVNMVAFWVAFLLVPIGCVLYAVIKSAH